METLNHPICTVGWVVRLYRSWLSPRKATRISQGRNPIGQYSYEKFCLFFNKNEKVVNTKEKNFLQKEFFRVNFVCWLLFGVRSTPLFPQWHVKDPGHSARSAGGRLHLNTHTPLTYQSRNGLTMLLSRHSVGTYQETSSHAARHLILDHSRLSSLNHRGPIMG